jgi:RimJ/RimL family protein N-acetyltransferase
MAAKKKMLPVRQLETERLVLKPISPFYFARQTFHWTSDRQALADLNMAPDGWTPLKWWKHMRKLNRGRRLTHGIWVKGQDTPIGLHMVSLPEPTGDAVTGILIGDAAWRGTGVAVEVKTAVITDLFDRYGVHRVTSWVNARNFASLHMTMRLGFKQEAQMRQQAALLDGSRVDFLGFGLLRSEWNARDAASAKKEGT